MTDRFTRRAFLGGMAATGAATQLGGRKPPPKPPKPPPLVPVRYSTGTAILYSNRSGWNYA